MDHSIMWGTAVCEVYTAVQNDSLDLDHQISAAEYKVLGYIRCGLNPQVLLDAGYLLKK